MDCGMGPSELVPAVSRPVFHSRTGCELTRASERLLQVLKVHVGRQIRRPGLLEYIDDFVLLERLQVSQCIRTGRVDLP